MIRTDPDGSLQRLMIRAFMAGHALRITPHHDFMIGRTTCSVEVQAPDGHRQHLADFVVKNDHVFPHWFGPHRPEDIP